MAGNIGVGQKQFAKPRKMNPAAAKPKPIAPKPTTQTEAESTKTSWKGI